MYYLAGTLFTFLSAAYHLWLEISSEGTELHSSTGYTDCHGGLFVQDSDVKLRKSAVETSKWRIVRSDGGCTSPICFNVLGPAPTKSIRVEYRILVRFDLRGQ
ncbi:hypothetical protein EDD22DRAFT_353204 [Suillus occidentalis]|nr:hypothetical protein EDD22DRAFT_353204 [Suillus occidentalis]